MTRQATHAEELHALHVPGRPLILYNIWDPGSARAVAAAGAKALATGSWSVAHALGYEDGEALPLDLAIDNLSRIVRATNLPVTVDLERGYGATPAEVYETALRAIEAGAVGCNIEDGIAGDSALRSLSDQAARISAVRRAAERGGINWFINARVDCFLNEPDAALHPRQVAGALERARAYASAGASGLFIPGATSEAVIDAVVRGSPLPVNTMQGGPSPTYGALAALGVARISHGPGPFRTAMMALEEHARRVLQPVP
jgi:2-methylisocitrate lyase-like PEP mutase family enzyme